MRYLFIFSLFAFIAACNTATKAVLKENPSAAGFNLTDSDAKAIAIADEVMQAMGGRHNYDQTRFLKLSLIHI